MNDLDLQLRTSLLAAGLEIGQQSFQWGCGESELAFPNRQHRPPGCCERSCGTSVSFYV